MAGRHAEALNSFAAAIQLNPRDPGSRSEAGASLLALGRTNDAVEQLRKPPAGPFFLAVGFRHPHVPCYAAKKWFDLYPADGLKLPVLGGGPAGDDALLKSFGDESVGLVTCSAYTSDLDTPSNKRLIDGMVRDYGNIPGIYSAGLYINGMVAEAALEKTGGKTDDREAFNKALRAVSLTDTPRGPFSFDKFGNVVGTFYIKRVDRKGDKLVNTTVKTYPKVSQFWTYDEKTFLSQPVYSRDFPPLKS